MQENELRLGNLIYNSYDKVIEVYPALFLDFDRMNDLISRYKGIPLTEEWLIKFGFENSKTQDKFFIKDNSIGISTADDGFRFIQGNFVCQIVLRELQYVHQLQNLYFALTGKELSPVNP